MRNKWFWGGLLILSLHLTLRLYRFEEKLGFGHDEDLAGWIIKDIFVDYNLRLIGQETSISGVFIGPLFYYLQGLFYLVFGMDPVGGFWMCIIIAILTLFSLWVLLKKLLGINGAFWGVLIYTVSSGITRFETWVVPTQPTLLWSCWYLYCLVGLLERNKKMWLGIGILWGLIWDVHVAFIPLVALAPLAIALGHGKKLIWSKYFLMCLGLVIILNLGTIVFEARHGWGQTKAILSVVNVDQNQISGSERTIKIYDGLSQSAITVFYNPKAIADNLKEMVAALSLAGVLGGLWYSRQKLGKVGWIILGWLVLVIVSQLVSKRAISEYYFANLIVPWIVIMATTISQLWQILSWRLVIGVVTIGMVVLNLNWTVVEPADNAGYLARKKVISEIRKDVDKRKYECIAINYITMPGRSAGYRYLLWKNNLKLITPGKDVPVYSIVDPVWYAPREIIFQSGQLGIIAPINPKVNPGSCDDLSRQLLPLWGFTN